MKRERRERFEALVVDEATTLEDIGQWLASGGHLPQWCKAKDIPQGRVMTWLMGDVRRWQIYLRGLEAQAHVEVAQAKGIADEATPETVGVARLQVDTAFKRAKHHAPQMYGEKVSVTNEVNLSVDVGLAGDAIELLEKMKRARFERVVESLPEVQIGSIGPNGSSDEQAK